MNQTYTMPVDPRLLDIMEGCYQEGIHGEDTWLKITDAVRASRGHPTNVELSEHCLSFVQGWLAHSLRIITTMLQTEHLFHLVDDSQRESFNSLPLQHLGIGLTPAERTFLKSPIYEYLLIEHLAQIARESRKTVKPAKTPTALRATTRTAGRLSVACASAFSLAASMAGSAASASLYL